MYRDVAANVSDAVNYNNETTAGLYSTGMYISDNGCNINF